jgi:hypothetical protein
MSHNNHSDCGRYGRPIVSRREFLSRSGAGIGTLALAALLADEKALYAADGVKVHPSRLRGKAKRVIMLFMGGGPSHVDTFDPKPEIARLQGKPVPESIAKLVPKIPRQGLASLHGSPFEFKQYGQSGIPVSSLFPNVARWVDELCVIRSMRHDSPIHTPAEYLATTGSVAGTRPSLGAWLTYGIGSENRDLPGFIVMLAGENYGGPACWSSGFLPAKYQGTIVDAAQGIQHIKMPDSVTSEARRRQLDALGALNKKHLERHGEISELEARIESYEMAFRMQTAAPEAFDLSKETDETKKLYGLDRAGCKEYGTMCLMGRRMIERGVRFVQLNQGGWDAHGEVKKNHTSQSVKVDRPIAGLLEDLKRRGLLEDTLVVWGGEFGRTPTAEGGGADPGRDHSPAGYTVWLAGAGVKGGQVIGATDELGYTAVENPIHPNDLHATILNALGIDQHNLHFMHNGRKEIVTVNGGRVVKEVFA